jgi:hypothetical protein
VFAKYQYILFGQATLLLAIGIWLVSPIFGVLALLLSLQVLGLSAVNRTIYEVLLNAIFLLVCITLAMFCGSIEPFGDTANYLQEYRACGALSFTDCLFTLDTPYEPGLYILAYPIFHLFDGADRPFILVWSFIINFVLFFLVCKPLSSKYAPLLGLTVVTNMLFYGHTFYMRQYMSTAFILAGIVNINTGLWSVLLLLWGCLNHYTSIFYLPLIYVDFKWLKKFIADRIWYVGLGVVLFLSIAIQIVFSEDAMKSILLLVLQMNQDSGLISNKTSYFMDDSVLEQKPVLVPMFVNIIAGIVFLRFKLSEASGNYNYLQPLRMGKLSRRENWDIDPSADQCVSIVHVTKRIDIFNPNFNIDRILITIYVIQLFMAILTINFGYLTLRLCAMTLSFTGIFMFPLLRRVEFSYGHRLFIYCFVGFSILYISYYFYNLTLDAATFEFVNGKVLTSSIFDYINFLGQRWSQLST